MTKPVWHYNDYPTFRRTGISMETIIVPDDFHGGYGYTDIEPPVELQKPTAVLFFDAETQTWADYSAEAQIIAIKKQASDLTDAKKDAADAKATVAAQAKTIQSLQIDLDTATAAIVQLAQATLPSTDTETEAK